MSFAGFKLREEEGQIILDFVMPSSLSEIFSVSLYGRGTLFDGAEGDPQIIWDNFAGKGAPCAHLVAPYQVHGTTVLDAVSERSLPLRNKADGVFLDSGTDASGSLRFADCSPVVVACGGDDPWLIILHSGFVGTIKNISSVALNEVFSRRSPVDANSIYAWIAPTICASCYMRKTDDPLTKQASAFFATDNYRIAGDYIYFDIRGEIKRQLQACGISEKNINVAKYCTNCDNDKFYSYRAGDTNRRNFLLAANTTKQRV